MRNKSIKSPYEYIGCFTLCFLAFFLNVNSLVYSQDHTFRIPNEYNAVERVTTNTIEFRRFDKSDRNAEIQLDHINIDIDAVSEHRFVIYFSQPTARRITEYLLTNELADLIDINNAPPDLVELYVQTQRAREQFPDYFADDPSEIESGDTFWTVDRFIAIGGIFVTILLSTLVVGQIVRSVRRYLYDRYATVLLLGLPSSGKTALFVRMTEPDAPEQRIKDLVESRGKNANTVSWFNIGRLRFIPTLVDIAGSRSELALDAAAKLVPGRRKKYALIFVLSATQGLDRSGTTEGFVEQQLGAMKVAAPTFLRANSVARPDVVAVFINKVDLAFEGSPSADQKNNHKSAFREHLELVKDAAKEKDVPVIEIVGSAMKGWGTERFLQEISNAMEN